MGVAAGRALSVVVETHGCRLNGADSRLLARRFLDAGYILTGEGHPADVYVLNTCTVTHVADRKARYALTAARRRHPGALIVATGCLVERVSTEVGALPAVDMVVPNHLRDRLVALVGGRLGVEPAPRGADRMRDVGEELLGRTRAFVKIQEGCDRACAYCVVPGVRGRQWSVPESEVVEEVGRLARGGCPEVVLTGTRPGSYGFDIAGASLAGLLERILADTGVGRVRVSSLEPGEIAGGLLDLWAGPGKGRLCPHFHLPLQSGSDAVLRRMGRRYTAGQFAGEVARIRGALPEAAVTTDVMAGFPGETEEDHRATLALMVGIRFSGAHVFPYSRRPGTPAARLGGHVRAETKARRAAEIRALAEHHAREFRLRFVGSVRQVLWEGRDRRTGLTDNYLRVRRAGRTPGQAGPDAPEWSGVIEDVELVALDGRDLVGRGRSCAGGGAGARSGQPVP